ncbi:hypothetical protein [Grimontia marina]
MGAWPEGKPRSSKIVFFGLRCESIAIGWRLMFIA